VRDVRGKCEGTRIASRHTLPCSHVGPPALFALDTNMLPSTGMGMSPPLKLRQSRLPWQPQFFFIGHCSTSPLCAARVAKQSQDLIARQRSPGQQVPEPLVRDWPPRVDIVLLRNMHTLPIGHRSSSPPLGAHVRRQHKSFSTSGKTQRKWPLARPITNRPWQDTAR